MAGKKTLEERINAMQGRIDELEEGRRHHARRIHALRRELRHVNKAAAMWKARATSRTAVDLLHKHVGDVARAMFDQQSGLDARFAAGDMNKSPCFACGYNGPGYYQPETHACAARHHALYRYRP